ncbi:putative Chase2 sensor protein (plasmid) [Stanieria sp. NIES-3757]|nr:putative Chase2 sensor protein [Stanieria sp. NIES-3757]
MSAILKFNPDTEAGFTLSTNYSSEEVFGVELYLSSQSANLNNRCWKGTLQKRPDLSIVNQKNVFEHLANWQKSIDRFKNNSHTDSLAIIDIKTISTDVVNQEIDEINKQIQGMIEEIRDLSNYLVLALHNWWAHTNQLNFIRNQLYENIINFTQQSNFQNDNIFKLFIQSDNRFIRQLPWEQSIKKWIIELSKHDHRANNISQLKLSVNFVSQDKENGNNLNYNYQKIFINNSESKKINVLVIIGSGIKIDQEERPDNLDSRLDSIQCQSNGQSIEINLQKIRPESCQDLAEKIESNSNFDILVFIGHSDTLPNSQGKHRGIIQLSQSSQFPIYRLRDTLRNINENNQKHRLLIFTSCSSLGLAEDVLNFVENISCIAYKEAITDILALDFLTSFFQEFCNPKNHNLDMVMLKTKQKISSTQEENDFSLEVSWLPVVALPPKRQTIPLIYIYHDFTKIFPPGETKFLAYARIIMGCCFGIILSFLQIEYFPFWMQFLSIFVFLVSLFGYFHFIRSNISSNVKRLIAFCLIILVLAFLFKAGSSLPKSFEFNFIIMPIEIIASVLIAYFSHKILSYLVD